MISSSTECTMRNSSNSNSKAPPPNSILPLPYPIYHTSKFLKKIWLSFHLFFFFFFCHNVKGIEERGGEGYGGWGGGKYFKIKNK